MQLQAPWFPPGADGRLSSLALLDALVEHTCAAPRVYTHRWSPGALLVWDNRCALHRARPYDYVEDAEIEVYIYEHSLNTYYLSDIQPFD